MKLSIYEYSYLIVYALICIGIGFWSSRHHKANDYLISGRNMSLFGFISTVIASYIGGAAIVAYSAYVYNFGISAIAVFLGTAIGFLVFIPYALKLKRISSESKFLTMSDWFYYKFDSFTGITSAIILFIVYFGMLVNQFIAGSSILAHISGMKYETALMISSVIITIYLLAGGFKSVVKTDIFQYIILFVLFILLGAVLVNHDAGFTSELIDVSRMDPLMTIVFIAFGILIIFQSAEYWQRVYAAKNETVVRKGLQWSAVLVVISGFAISLVGLSAHLHVPGIEPRNAFAEGLGILLPRNYLGASLVLLFAAIMSSADTIIFVLASSIAKDYVAHFTKDEPDEQKLKKITQAFILIFALAGFGMAFFFRNLVTVIIFITGVGFTVIPGAIASFHWKMKARAIWWSFIIGLGYVIILMIFNQLIPELSIASIVIATITLVVAQKILKTKDI